MTTTIIFLVLGMAGVAMIVASLVGKLNWWKEILFYLCIITSGWFVGDIEKLLAGIPKFVIIGFSCTIFLFGLFYFIKKDLKASKKQK